MKLQTFTAGFLTLACFSIQAGESQLTDNTPRKTALTHATLVLSPEKTLPNATLVIENNKILEIISHGNIPQDAYEINLEGYRVYAGFIDPYAEYAITEQAKVNTKKPPVYKIDRIGGNAANGAIHAEKEWFSQVSPDSKSAQKWIKNGFTSVQSAHMDGIFQGTSVTLSLADKKANDIIYKSRGKQFMSFNKGSSVQDYPTSLMGSMALIRQTFSDARWYNDTISKAADYPETVSKPEFNIALERLKDIKAQGVIFNTDNLNNELRAAKLLKQQGLSVQLLGTGHEYARIDELAQYHPQLILPLNYPAAPAVDNEADAANVSLSQLRHWERAPGNPAVVARQQIPFALTQYGIDAKAFWPRLKMAVSAGLSEQQALTALTTQAAELAGISHMAGKLAPGYMADLVITKGSPFTNGEIVGVWLQGKAHQLRPENHVWQGDYKLNFAQLELDLSLKMATGTDGEPHGTFNSGDDEVAITNISADKKRIHFSAELSAAGIAGISRFTLWRDDEGLRGRLLLADGRIEPVNGVSIAPVDHQAEASTAPPNTYISQQVTPQQAFGVATLPATEKLHIKNAMVWTSASSGNLPDTDVLIANGKITRIGQQLSTPSGYQVIDAKGKYLTAGIIDEHSHIAINGGVNEGTEAVTAEVRIGDVINPDAVEIYRSLAGGVTTANLLHGSANPIGGQAQVIQLRWGETADGLKFKEANPGIKFALGENVKQSNWGDNFKQRFPQSRMGVKALFADTFNAALEYDNQRQEYAELRSRNKRRTPEPRPDYRLDAVAQVVKGERDVHIHSYVQSEILMFLRLAEAYDFQVKTFTHVLEGYKVAPELAAHGAGASTFADWWAYKFEVYDAIAQNACLMQQHGVLTSINSDDYEMQRRLNQEAAKSVQYCDMSQQDAWNMITINPAKQLGVDAITGSIEPGKQADLVLWDQNPLSAYAKTEAVWIKGKRYFDRTLDAKKTQAIANERQALIQKILRSSAKRQQGEPLSVTPEPMWHCDTHYNAWSHKEISQ
ncbi:amidohydrolase family protein [Shewanella sp. YIC-542]|uniref:amidohydrolase family protein n=1 Tax=Shewanella mytili TaxID=3377111 RepID=UPI00398E4F32